MSINRRKALGPNTATCSLQKSPTFKNFQKKETEITKSYIDYL
jgi:hypothetical protein